MRIGFMLADTARWRHTRVEAAWLEPGPGPTGSHAPVVILPARGSARRHLSPLKANQSEPDGWPHPQSTGFLLAGRRVGVPAVSTEQQVVRMSSACSARTERIPGAEGVGGPRGKRSGCRRCEAPPGEAASTRE
jgi:hypothetical protein